MSLWLHRNPHRSPQCKLLASALSCLQTVEMQGRLLSDITSVNSVTPPCQKVFGDTSAITRLVNCFRDAGSVEDRKRPGRPLVLKYDNLDDIRQTLLRSPPKSLNITLFSCLLISACFIFDKYNVCQEWVV